MNIIVGRHATPEQALRERSALDDIAAALYMHHGRSVVLRLRDGARRVIVIDDGGEAVHSEPVETIQDVERVLPAEAGEGDVGYELAREVIMRAYTESNRR